MKTAQAKKVLDKYICLLEKKGYIAKRDDKHIAPHFSQGHILWMCYETKKFVDTNKMDKANRWLGFIQGCLWMLGIYSIDEMREHNRSKEKELPQCLKLLPKNVKFFRKPLKGRLNFAIKYEKDGTYSPGLVTIFDNGHCAGYYNKARTRREAIRVFLDASKREISQLKRLYKEYDCGYSEEYLSFFISKIDNIENEVNFVKENQGIIITENAYVIGT